VNIHWANSPLTATIGKVQRLAKNVNLFTGSKNKQLRSGSPIVLNNKLFVNHFIAAVYRNKPLFRRIVAGILPIYGN